MTRPSGQAALVVIADYAVPINDMMALNGQIAQGANDPALTNDVQTLNSLSQEKDQVSQQRAILYDAFTKGAFANAEQEALFTVVAGQSAAATAFEATATPAEQNAFTRVVSGTLVKQAVNIEKYVVSTGRLDIGNGALTSARRTRLLSGISRCPTRSTGCRRSSWGWPGTSSPGPRSCSAARSGPRCSSPS